MFRYLRAYRAVVAGEKTGGRALVTNAARDNPTNGTMGSTSCPAISKRTFDLLVHKRSTSSVAISCWTDTPATSPSKLVPLLSFKATLKYPTGTPRQRFHTL